MKRYRTQPKIIGDVLRTAALMGSEGKGLGVTALLRECNMPYTRLAELLSQLVGAGLLARVDEEGEHPSYAITPKGREYSEKWSNFEELAESFGLRL